MLRSAFLTSIPEEFAQYEQPEPRFLYVPGKHLSVLALDRMLVTGIRGAGKTFWWRALQNASLRARIIRHVQVTVSTGFGEDPSPDDYPSRDTLEALLAKHSARLVWRAVLLLHATRAAGISLPTATPDWAGLARQCAEDPERVARQLYEADERLEQNRVCLLVLFDALDLTAAGARERTVLLDGLLANLLDLRPTRALRAKVFVRPDMLKAPGIGAFPDASKVLAQAASLDWQAPDLYGLLFQYLGNARNSEAAEAFRMLATEHIVGPVRPDDWYTGLRHPAIQRDVFTQLAGPWMGANHRRGSTYTWAPNHLADAHGQVSPRSFLAAMRGAAEHEAPPGHPHALHWRGLQQGVRDAAKIRRLEVREDLPWADAAMDALRGLLVPCTRAEVLERWERAAFAAAQGGASQVLTALGDAGLLALLPGSRVNIPDIYRVGFELRRKGGLAP